MDSYLSSPTAFLNKHRDIGWFGGWLLYQQDAPINLAPHHYVRRCRIAWHHVKLLRELEIPLPTYHKWFDRFPADNVFAWTRWLYGGGVPDGWVVISEKMLSLKTRLSPVGSCKAARVHFTTFKRWLKDPVAWAALSDAVSRMKHCNPKDLERVLNKSSEAWQRLTSEWSGKGKAGPLTLTKNAMLRYAKASTMRSAFADVGMSRSGYQNWMRDAKARAGDASVRLLEEFIRDDQQRGDRAGIVADGLFLPSATMRRFRDAALKLGTRQHVRAVEGSIQPGVFRVWFLDWTLPPKHRERVLERDGSVVRMKAAATNSTQQRTDPPKRERAEFLKSVEADTTRPCFERDHTFLAWYEAEGTDEYHSDARIRDRWNREHPEDAISDGENGRETVKKARQKARLERGH